MRLDYIVSPKIKHLPSYRYRIGLPMKHMNPGVHRVRVTEDYDGEADIIVMTKYKRPATEQAIAVDAKKAGTRVIFDMCDNHFMSEAQGGVVKDHNYMMCDLATDITCPTYEMVKVIKEYAGRDAVVIPDPWEMPEIEPTEFSGIPKVMWYGFDTTINRYALLGAKIKYPLECISQVDERGTFDNVTFIPYSHEEMLAGFRRNDIVAIPSINDARCLTKSHNRLLEGLRGGMIVCAAPLPSYQEFADFCYLDWDINRAIEAVLDDPDAAIEKTRAGQEYIRERYSPKTIARQWQKFLFA